MPSVVLKGALCVSSAWTYKSQIRNRKQTANVEFKRPVLCPNYILYNIKCTGFTIIICTYSLLGSVHTVNIFTY